MAETERLTERESEGLKVEDKDPDEDREPESETVEDAVPFGVAVPEVVAVELSVLEAEPLDDSESVRLSDVVCENEGDIVMLSEDDPVEDPVVVGTVVAVDEIVDEMEADVRVTVADVLCEDDNESDGDRECECDVVPEAVRDQETESEDDLDSDIEFEREEERVREGDTVKVDEWVVEILKDTEPVACGVWLEVGVCVEDKEPESEMVAEIDRLGLPELECDTVPDAEREGENEGDIE